MYEIEEIIAASEDDTPDIPDEDENECSWAIEDGAAIKQTDRHTFLYRETIVPPEVLEYFGARGLEPGRKQKIVLWYGDRRFDAYIEKTVHTKPRTRLLWKADFAAVLGEHYPEWLDFFKKNRTESGDTPSLQFTRRAEPGHVDVDLEGAGPAGGAGDFLVPIEAGDTIDNDTLHGIFRCSLLGPMRRSLRTNTLVLISDHTKSVYEDKWIGKVFHYTGMGVIGEQSLAFQQNRTLAESRENGVGLFLFEVFEEGRYMYMGEVELMDSPYRSRQPDSGKVMRDVWVFPLRLKSNRNPPLVKKEPDGTPVPERALRVTARGPEPAGDASGTSGMHEAAADLFEPDQLVPEYAQRRANGTCQLCGLPAPFAGHDGKPYLETHHIIPLAEGGADAIGNVVALCPNCHRKMHVLNLQADAAKLRERVSKA